jgi:hypothetical protein
MLEFTPNIILQDLRLSRSKPASVSNRGRKSSDIIASLLFVPHLSNHGNCQSTSDQLHFEQ